MTGTDGHRARYFSMSNTGCAQETPMHDSSDSAVDHWIHRELTRTYDGVLNEELPEQLVQLLDSLAHA